jgi:hypothetical protein
MFRVGLNSKPEAWARLTRAQACSFHELSLYSGLRPQLRLSSGSGLGLVRRNAPRCALESCNNDRCVTRNLHGPQKWTSVHASVAQEVAVSNDMNREREGRTGTLAQCMPRMDQRRRCHTWLCMRGLWSWSQHPNFFAEQSF